MSLFHTLLSLLICECQQQKHVVYLYLCASKVSRETQTNKQTNKTFTYCPPSFGVDPACFNALAMSDFWARMPPFRDSNSSRRSDCSVASAWNACSWVMFVSHSSRWSSVRSSVVLSSVVDSVLPSVVGRLVVRSVVGCRLSVVGRRSLSSSVSRWSSVVLSVVRRPSSVSLPGPSASELSRDSLPNSLPPRSSRLSSSASRATHCQSAFLLSASVDSSDNRSGCLARASLRFPPGRPYIV